VFFSHKNQPAVLSASQISAKRTGCTSCSTLRPSLAGGGQVDNDDPSEQASL